MASSWFLPVLLLAAVLMPRATTLAVNARAAEQATAESSPQAGESQRSLLSMRMRVVDLDDDNDDDTGNADGSFSTFAHLAKCGGTLMKHALRASVRDLRLSNENSRLFDDQTASGEFTIGTVRNPYDYYASDWAFVSAPERYNGSLKRIAKDLGEDAARKVLGFDVQKGRKQFGHSRKDVANFRRFVNESQFHSRYGDIGLMSLRFYAKYLDKGHLWPEPKEAQHSMIPTGHWTTKGILSSHFTKEAYDHIRSSLRNFSIQESPISCWVKNENLVTDIKRCLKVYEDHAAARGIDTSHLVNWERLDEKLSESQRHSDHVPCETLYNKDLIDQVAKGDAELLRAFRYRKHCHGQNGHK